VHLHFISYCSSIVLACRFLRIKSLVFTDHRSSKKLESKISLLTPIKNLRKRFYASLISHFIAVSCFVGSRLKIQENISEKKISIIYNGVDLERFSRLTNPDSKLKLKQELLKLDSPTFVVSFIGQLIQEKGIHVFLQAAEKLLETRDDILFLAVGDIQQMGISENEIQQRWSRGIRFLGSRDNVEDYLRASDLLICPSIWQEAFGLVLAEAMACGVPVIAARMGGIPEVVSHLNTGILVPPGDPAELIKNIETLLSNKKMRDKFGKAGRERVEKHFGLEEMVSKTISLYYKELNK
jgi:glycosyltransferase involved in cell wall biosynthesis